MADFRLRVTAETQDAERKLRAVDKAANEASKNRNIKVDVSGIQDINKRFRDISASVKEAGNNIQTFYRFSKNIPGVGDRIREVEALAKGTAQLVRTAPESAAALRENAKAGSILSNSFEAAGGAAGRLINTLAKTGFAIFAVKEAVGVLQAAFGGFFNETIGREIKLRETILKTQTTLASTNKVFRGGKEITDPYEKIVALTGEVGKRIDSIRERSIALAGVTSNDVIEVFGIVASQVGQIGGGLKDAEDLAISFSAALGTFGLPLEQARQEIGSILRGDVGPDSYLAKALGITNQDIAKAKGQAGGIVKFLEERLAASVAGQKIAAQGFAGVVSNIRDLGELISQKFGAGLLDPMLGGLTKVFDFLFKIREEVFAISEALGKGLGSLLTSNLTLISGGSGLLGQIGGGAEGFAAQLAESVKSAFASLKRDAATFVAPLRNILEEVVKTVGLLAQGLAKLAKGFIDIKIENFKALVQIFSNLTEGVTLLAKGLSEILKLYGGLLQLPLVQYLSQVSVQFQLLDRLGLGAAVRLGAAAVGLIAAWQPIISFFQALVARIAALLGGLVIAIGAVITRIGVLIASFAATITATYPAVEALKQQLMGLSASFTTAGASADKAGVSVARFGGATTTAARAVGTAIFGFFKLNLILLAVQLGITLLIDRFGSWQRAQDKAASDRRAEEALKKLRTTYKDVGDSADEATKRAKQFEQALVDAKYNEAVERLEGVKKKLEEIRDLTSGNKQDFGDYMRRIAQLFNPANFDAFIDQRKGEMFADAVYRKRVEDAKKAETEANRWSQELNKKSAEDNIRLEADKRTNLEKEIGDLRRQQEDQLFQLRQQRAQKEVEIFRAAGELRIFQMEQANNKLIEGEEGASAAALKSLNNYLSTRERGELEIEAAKKGLAIEVANLDKQIADYRLDNERKIAEIRKKAGEYEKNVADYQRQMATSATPPAEGVSAGFRVGSTGKSSGPHLDIRSPSGNKQAVIDEAVAIIKAWQKQNLAYIELSNARIDVKKMTDEAQLRRALAKEQQVHARRSGGGAIDIAVPAGTLVPVPATKPEWGGAGGWQARSKKTGNLFLHGLQNSVATPGEARAPASAVASPKAPNFTDVGAPAVAKYEGAIRSLTSAMARLAAIQAALTGARTKEAFDAVAKSVFEPVGLEQYEDKMLELQGVMASLAKGTFDAFNPERTQIAAEQAAKILSSDRERDQIIKGINANYNVSEKERIALIERVRARHAEFVQSLRDEQAVRQSLNALQLGTDLIRNLETQIQQTTRANEATRLRNRLQLEGVDPDVIQKELDKLKISQDVEAAKRAINNAITEQIKLQDKLAEKIKKATPKELADLRAELDKANRTIEELRKRLAEVEGKGKDAQKSIDSQEKPVTKKRDIRDVVKQWKEDLKDMDEELASFAETIQSELGGAIANSVLAITNGTGSIREAFANMFKNIYQSWVKMISDMIAKWILVKLIGLFLPGASDGAAFTDKSGQAGSNNVALTWAANGASFSNGIARFARGGTFTNSVVNSPTLFRYADGGVMSTGVMGEAGPEAILPLKRGPGGKLGVESSGTGGNVSVVVNVDASGSKVKGDNEQANQLGRVVASAVQQELIKQKRPGGLLA